MHPWITCLECGEQFQGVRCVCGWEPPKQKGPSHSRHTDRQLQDGISRAEFGERLYHTITLIGGIKELRVLRGHVAMGDLLPADYDQRETHLIEQLNAVLVTLPPNEVTEIVAAYPWITSC